MTDAGLEHLEGLTKLQGLDLKGTEVTDAGLEYLNGLTKLRFAHPDEYQGDRCWQALKGLVKLRVLGWADTRSLIRAGAPQRVSRTPVVRLITPW